MQEIMTNIGETISRYNMLSKGDSVVAGVSGGADSMLLLHYLLSIKDELELKIIVANVEHGIRGEESLRDTEFVKQFCSMNDVECRCLSIDAINESKIQGLSVEEYSRIKRYEFFDSIPCDKIATAHNLSDNVETVLFRLARGTSIKGCCGIPPVRGKIIRPLINCSSNDIRQYCDKNDIRYVIDSTNSNNDYSRNLIRNKIVPNFFEINSNFENNFNRFIEASNENEKYLDTIAQEAFKEANEFNELKVDVLKSLDFCIAKRVIVKYLINNNVSVDSLHLDEIMTLLNKSGKQQIRNSLFMVSNGITLRLAEFNEKVDFSQISVSKKVLSLDEYLTNSKFLSNKFDFYCDCDKICNNVIVRSRNDGDKITPANRHCTKSLKKLYNELKIDVEKRDNIPVVCDDKGVIGIVGYCCDERVKIDKDTKKVLLINVRMEDSF